jgi:hypothetical protein
LKISQSLLGKKLSSSTREKMSQSRLGDKNQFWKKSLPKFTLDAAAAVLVCTATLFFYIKKKILN